MRTVQDLARAVMGRCLGLQEAQEEVSPEDYAEIVRSYEDLYDGWLLEDLPWWDRDAIPEHALPYVADQVAELVSPSFGKAIQPVNYLGKMVSMGERGRRGLIRLRATVATGLPVYSEYF